MPEKGTWKSRKSSPRKTFNLSAVPWTCPMIRSHPHLPPLIHQKREKRLTSSPKATARLIPTQPLTPNMGRRLSSYLGTAKCFAPLGATSRASADLAATSSRENRRRMLLSERHKKNLTSSPYTSSPLENSKRPKGIICRPSCISQTGTPGHRRRTAWR